MTSVSTNHTNQLNGNTEIDAPRGVEENENQQYWQKDDEAPVCNKCQRSFTLLRRRSHCRSCGRIFCHDCSAHRMELPATFKWKGKVRVCDSCYLYHMNLQNQGQGAVAEKPDTEKLVSEFNKDIIDVINADSTQWKETKKTKNITIFKLNIPDSNIYCFKTVTIIDQPPHIVWNIYSQDNLWVNWQDASITIVDNISSSSHILYVSYRLPVVDNRDACLYSWWRRGTYTNPNQQDSFLLCSRSVEHTSCPRTKSFVRCNVSISMTTIEPFVKDGKTQSKLTTYLHFDPRGLIPAFFVNTALSMAIDSIERMRVWIQQHGLEYYSRKHQN